MPITHIRSGHRVQYLLALTCEFVVAHIPKSTSAAGLTLKICINRVHTGLNLVWVSMYAETCLISEVTNPSNTPDTSFNR